MRNEMAGDRLPQPVHEVVGGATAPGDLELVRGFLSLHDHQAGDPDSLEPSTGSMAWWLHDRELLPSSEEPTEADLIWTLVVRNALVSKVLENMGAAPDPVATDRLNAAVEETGLRPPLRRRSARGEQRRHPRRGRAAPGDRVPGGAGRLMAPVQAMRGSDLPHGLLRPNEEPLRQMVLDAVVRQPEQGPRLPRTPRGTDMSTRLELPLRGPGGERVDLWRTLNSHGFAELAPTTLDEGADPRRDARRPGSEASTRGDRDRAERTRGRRRPRTVPGGGDRGGGRRGRASRAPAGPGPLRFLREGRDRPRPVVGGGRAPVACSQSPTVFEDVVKTICTTNCAWGATVRMVDALVDNLGEPAVGGDGPRTNAFPTPERMADAPESFYRDVVRAGYRGAYLIALARSVAAGELDLEALARATPDELPDPELEQRLLSIAGVGPYAAAHIMMTIGRNSRLILDSWTRPDVRAARREEAGERCRDRATLPSLRRARGPGVLALRHARLGRLQPRVKA